MVSYWLATVRFAVSIGLWVQKCYRRMYEAIMAERIASKRPAAKPAEALKPVEPAPEVSEAPSRVKPPKLAQVFKPVEAPKPVEVAPQAEVFVKPKLRLADVSPSGLPGYAVKVAKKAGLPAGVVVALEKALAEAKDVNAALKDFFEVM